MPARAIDPTWLTALHFADFGSVYSADGREHPVTGMTPVYVNDPTSAPQAGSPTAGTPTSQVGMSWPGWLTPDFLKTQHVGARVVIGILAIGILLIVALRLTK